MSSFRKIAARFIAMFIVFSAPSQSPATMYIEYRADGEGPGHVSQQASPYDSPYELSYEKMFVGITALVIHNDPVLGAGFNGYIGISSYDYGHVDVNKNHLLFDIYQDRGHGGILSSSVDICFDQDLGGQLPTSAHGFVPDCSSIFVYDGSYYFSQYAYGPVHRFSARVLEGPDYNILVSNVEARFTPHVPEPATWIMMVIGFGTIGIAARRNRHCPKSDSLDRRRTHYRHLPAI